MAIQKSIVDKYGATHPEAYVIIGAINIARGENTTDNITVNKTSIQIKVFHDSNARSKSDSTIIKNPLAIEWGHVVSDDSDTYFTDTVLKTADKSLLSQAYTWVKTQSNLGGIDFTTGTTDV